ncbi:MAG: SusC/RagA family TonB-linked outer membrane protein, partial [Bacteroidota bacterium]
VSLGDIIVASYIGFEDKEVRVGSLSETTINFTLAESAQALEEVVVIGLGTKSVGELTESVTSVSAEDFNGGVIASPEQLIQGKAAGVQITNATGEPGAGVAIRIRGTNSVRSNNNPLFVVDGVPLTNEGTSAEGTNIGVGSSSAKNPLNFLNPNDIESISILKDASATAIYGSRGANGVVIITTKSGRGGQGGKWEFGSSLSVASPANRFDLLGREQFLSAVEQYGANVAENDSGANTDWQDVITRTSLSHDQTLSYSRSYGEKNKGYARATFGYGNQVGIIENSSLERITGRINANQFLLDNRLNLTLQSTLSTVNDEIPATSGSAGFQGDLIGAAYSANPTWPNDPDFAAGGLLNPAALLRYAEGLTDTNRFLINASAAYDIIKTTDNSRRLTAKATFGYDTSTSTRTGAISSLGQNLDLGVFGNGRAAINDLDTRSKLVELTLSYETQLENSKFDVLAGFSYQDFRRFGRNVTGWGFSVTDMGEMIDNLERSASAIENSISGSYQQYGLDGDGLFINRLFPDIDSEEGLPSPTGISVASVAADTFDNTDELQSFFARANYSIAEKYLFTATVRADGSSRFGGDNRYGIFPSAAFAWRINQEDFMTDSPFSNLKVRLNWGITGNQEGLGYGNFVRRERFGGITIQNDGNILPPGIGPVAFAEPSLKWEETTQYGFGIDFGINNNRLNGNIDLYRKETRDLLLRIEAAQPSPQPFIFQNIDAVVLNQGIEFAINYDVLRAEDYNWNVGFNIAYNQNELQDFDGQIPSGTIRGQGLSEAFSQILVGGRPLFSYYLREFEGFDSDGQPIGDIQDFTGKSALPTVNAGLSTSARYKNWSFSAFFAGQFGFYVYNNTANAFFTAGAIANGRNVTPDVLTTNEGGNAAADVSTRFLEKGDFVRLQNLNIAYNIPLGENSLLKSVRLSLNAQNLFLITGYSGLDPEISSTPGGGDLLNGLPTAGIDYAAYPRPRIFTLGLNATF